MPHLSDLNCKKIGRNEKDKVTAIAALLLEPKNLRTVSSHGE